MAVQAGAAVVLLAAAVLALRPPAANVADTVSNTTLTVDESAKVDLARPFVDTPADSWAEGETGIVPPAAVAIGRYSADQVATVMGAVRRLIATSRLNRYVIETHDAEPVLALLAPHQAEEMRTQRANNEAGNWRLSVRIARGYELLPVTPRATGTMAVLVNAKGELVIRTNYLVAYAFDAPDPSSLDGPLDIVAVDRWEADYIWVDDERYDAGSQGIYYGDFRGFQYSVNCALPSGIIAPAYSDPTTVRPHGPNAPPESYFDPNAPMQTVGGC
ncbi:hypothetical protein [Nocardia salmonicida]|uniref:hypothetical protein n=1 Tax=Nocardia salmonicida TaxID=53431 RepID=UPI002E2C63BF|nr:hypothetical protein [Nocardia salmonicida]